MLKKLDSVKFNVDLYIDEQGNIYQLVKVGEINTLFTKPEPEKPREGSTAYTSESIKNLDKFRSRRNDMHSEDYDD